MRGRPLRTALLLLLLTPPAAAAAPPRIRDLAGPHAAPRYGRVETRANVSPVPANPFDPAEIDVTGVFVGPDGREQRAIGFWYQDYERVLVGGVETLTPVGAPHFRVRFRPDQIGAWRWWWEVRTSGGFATSEVRKLRVRPSKRHGFLRVSSHDPRHLAFDDGTSYFAVGENLGWYDARGSFAYDAWLAALDAQEANFVRLWMPSWAMGIEWNDTGLGDYTGRLDRAWQLDHVLAEAERRGFQVLLALQNHGAFSTETNSEWAGNPYNAANGGPIAEPGAFFSDPEAKEFFQRRLRYIVARFGHSTALLAWELWNEADLVDGYFEAPSAAWHAEMAELLRGLDPHDHLVTTSFASAVQDNAVWSQGGLDFTQAHFYSTFEQNGRPTTLFPNIASILSVISNLRRALSPLPLLFAELGVDARGPAETRAADPEGIGIHDGLWAGVMSGGFGTAMTWWWDNLIDVEPERYYPMFGAVARFVRGVAFDREGFETFQRATSAGGRPLIAYGLRGPGRVLLWLKDDAFQWNTPASVEIAGTALVVNRVGQGAWCGRWYDPWAGSWREEIEVVAMAGRFELAVPAFERDVAASLERCER